MNQAKKVSLKFNQNNKRVKQIRRLLRRSKKARKQARVHTKVEADGVGGDATAKKKFRLKK